MSSGIRALLHAIRAVRRHGRRAAAALAVALLLVPGVGHAWPDRPVRLVVPFPPGGGADVAARMLTQRLAERWGQPVLIDNRAGGNTVIGADVVAKAAPDGYTLLMAMDGTLTQNPFLFQKLSYDPVADFAPVSLIVSAPMAVIASERFPGKTLGDWVDSLRRAPQPPNYGIAGIPHQLISGVFLEQAGVKANPVMYRGSAPTAQGLMAGDVDLVFDGIAPYLGFVKDGRAKVLAVSTARRSSALPEVPTIAEAGWPGFDLGVWFGIVAPAGTPVAILDRLQADFAAVVHEPEVRAKLATFTFEPVGSSREAFAKVIRDDSARFGPLIRKLGLKLD